MISVIPTCLTHILYLCSSFSPPSPPPPPPPPSLSISLPPPLSLSISLPPPSPPPPVSLYLSPTAPSFFPVSVMVFLNHHVCVIPDAIRPPEWSQPAQGLHGVLSGGGGPHTPAHRHQGSDGNTRCSLLPHGCRYPGVRAHIGYREDEPAAWLPAGRPHQADCALGTLQQGAYGRMYILLPSVTRTHSPFPCFALLISFFFRLSPAKTLVGTALLASLRR